MGERSVSIMAVCIMVVSRRLGGTMEQAYGQDYGEPDNRGLIGEAEDKL